MIGLRVMIGAVTMLCEIPPRAGSALIILFLTGPYWYIAWFRPAEFIDFAKRYTPPLWYRPRGFPTDRPLRSADLWGIRLFLTLVLLLALRHVIPLLKCPFFPPAAP